MKINKKNYSIVKLQNYYQFLMWFIDLFLILNFLVFLRLILMKQFKLKVICFSSQCFQSNHILYNVCTYKINQFHYKQLCSSLNQQHPIRRQTVLCMKFNHCNYDIELLFYTLFSLFQHKFLLKSTHTNDQISTKRDFFLSMMQTKQQQKKE
ncbi:transmembrane protein, putative (macronuclear) [Tetrahymena thermophila SB210]|uniref:Transmembrane protein, putative n=1 Tax=Tetrahymena thermophila (strain SB210) TaxID=312017 RepID=W7XFK5_TETTS|nr:transmembrane protein, putative [Tetrahymena thermophila SB210]EWS75623.1 transmembrane protein, putative [Tetrahymena thermophila SB210]|eukprot:XP_012651842.1 transmembrane protein, putative [Tetrahymena thermophila SB210]